MNTSTDALEDLTGTLAGLLADRDLQALGGDALLADAALTERLGRLVDARRVAVAAAVADRSRRGLGTEGLPAGQGCRNANELLHRVTLVSGSSAERRIRLGGQVRPRLSLTGGRQSAVFAHVAAALAAGVLGVDAAQTILHRHTSVLAHGHRQKVDATERELVAAAMGAGKESEVPWPAEAVPLKAIVWQGVLHRDGTDQSEQHASRKRFPRLGREQDGLVKLTAAVLPEVAAKLLRLLGCGLAPKTAPAFASAEKQAAHLAWKAAKQRVQTRRGAGECGGGGPARIGGSALPAAAGA